MLAKKSKQKIKTVDNGPIKDGVQTYSPTFKPIDSKKEAKKMLSEVRKDVERQNKKKKRRQTYERMKHR